MYLTVLDVAIFLLNLTGGPHLEFLQLCISDMFEKEVSMFPFILVTVDQLVKKWQIKTQVKDLREFFPLIINIQL